MKKYAVTLFVLFYAAFMFSVAADRQSTVLDRIAETSRTSDPHPSGKVERFESHSSQSRYLETGFVVEPIQETEPLAESGDDPPLRPFEYSPNLCSPPFSSRAPPLNG